MLEGPLFHKEREDKAFNSVNLLVESYNIRIEELEEKMKEEVSNILWLESAIKDEVSKQRSILVRLNKEREEIEERCEIIESKGTLFKDDEIRELQWENQSIRKDIEELEVRMKRMEQEKEGTVKNKDCNVDTRSEEETNESGRELEEMEVELIDLLEEIRCLEIEKEKVEGEIGEIVKKELEALIEMEGMKEELEGRRLNQKEEEEKTGREIAALEEQRREYEKIIKEMSVEVERLENELNSKHREIKEVEECIKDYENELIEKVREQECVLQEFERIKEKEQETLFDRKIQLEKEMEME